MTAGVRGQALWTINAAPGMVDKVLSLWEHTKSLQDLRGVHSTPKICVMLSSLQTGLKIQGTMSLMAWYVFDPVNMYHICLLKATSLSWHRIGSTGHIQLEIS